MLFITQGLTCKCGFIIARCNNEYNHIFECNLNKSRYNTYLTCDTCDTE